MTTTRADRTDECSPRARVTKSLLGYGVIVGPFYVVASVTQGLLTPGFSFSRDSWSLLSLGPSGWVHVGVFLLTGLMLGAGAVGFRRHLRGATGASASIWLMIYGALLIVAGVALPDRPGTGTLHGVIHLASGGLGFIAFAIACFALARRFRRESAGLLAAGSVASGVLLLVGFVGIAVASGSAGAVIGFTVTVCLAWAWLTVVSLRFYREADVIGRAEASN
jgi:Protein of unknown function (DUF998)